MQPRHEIRRIVAPRAAEWHMRSLGFGPKIGIAWLYNETTMEQSKEVDETENPVAWARTETIKFYKRKARQYGLLALLDLPALVLAFASSGHSMFHFVGPALGVLLVFFVSVTIFYSCSA
jgi:hypothetical protein